MHAKNAKDSVLAINHWNIPLQLAGVFVCCWGAAWFFGFAIFIQAWKPLAVVQTIGSVLVFLVMLGLGLVGVLEGLKLILGPDGVRIDPKKKEVCVWRRTLRLTIKRRVFQFEKLKQIKIAIRKKRGTFGPGCFNVYSVIAGNEPDDVELSYFPNLSKAEALAKRVAEVSGLQFLEYDRS